MPETPPDTLGAAIDSALDRFLADLLAAAPRVASALVFVVLAGLATSLLVRVLGMVLGRTLAPDATVYRQFAKRLVAVVLWFGIVLGALSILGLEQVAAALGTASGFLALGIAYALSGMIEDAVAGIYLLRDPDFNPGDTVTVDDRTGEVVSIELRKTRLEVEGDRLVLGNAAIESEWRRRDA